MHELCKQVRFDSAHTLERAIETESSRRVHGHSYRAEVAIRGTPDPDSGMLIDLGFFTQALQRVHDALDHRLLDEVEDLGPATLENLSSWIWRRLEGDLSGLHRVTVMRDSYGDACSYFGPAES